MNLGEKIKSLRKQRNLSQEVLAQYLGVSFQAVSKWENGSTMPDVTMIPAIASFFGITTDELFDFHLYEVEKQVDAIVDEHRKYIETDKEKAEQILREGLKRHPGSEVLLNCLIGVLPLPERGGEVIAAAKALVESTKCDEIRFDAYRIMAEAYRSQGEYGLAKAAIAHIPELYFTKLEVAAGLLIGDEGYEAAQKQKNLSADSLVDMLIRVGQHLQETGEREKAAGQLRIALQVIDAFRDDFLEKRFFRMTVYEGMREKREEIERRLRACIG